VDVGLIMQPWLGKSWLPDVRRRKSHTPLEDEYREWRNKHDEFLHSEFYDWVEWRALE
jgi:hypothetical protein